MRLTGSFCAECGTSFEEMDGEVAIIARQREIQRRFQEVMGENFFGIEEATKHFKVTPTPKQLAILTKIPFSKPVLKELKKTHILIAVFPLSILNIRKMNAKLFDEQSWYNDQSFAKEHGETSWQLIRKTPVPNSTSKKKLLAKDDEVPTAQVMVYTIIGHYLATGERLFRNLRNIRVRTSSLDSSGNRVNVGYFYSDGLDINRHWGDYDSSCRGVSSARKF